MSRAYRISVSESLRRHVVVGDRVESKLGLLDVLPPEQMADLLERRLAEAGFEKQDGKMVRVDDDGVTVEVDLQSQTIEIRIEGDVDVDLKIDAKGFARSANDEKAVEALRQSTQKRLEAQAKATAERARGELTDRLESALKDLRPELDTLTNKVIGDALKQRAGELGEIQEISEEENGSLTIRVKV